MAISNPFSWISDFFLWFFSDFLSGVNSFMQDNTLATPVNWLTDKINGALSVVGLSSLGVPVIPVLNASNFQIIVSLTLFVGVGVAIFLLLKNVLFNWA